MVPKLTFRALALCRSDDEGLTLTKVVINLANDTKITSLRFYMWILYDP